MRTLQSLHKGGHIPGLKDNVSFAKDRVCRACVDGKMHDSSHKAKTIISSKRILELLHVDLFGAVPEASLGGKIYCLVIVDDYSRYTWVYFFPPRLASGTAAKRSTWRSSMILFEQMMVEAL